MSSFLFKLFTLIAVAIGSASQAFAQQAFYVYRNDGKINAFISTEIDSMTFSCIDLDSTIHDDYVVQEIYTQDSIYRISLNVIDSVGLKTPQTIYQPGVKVISGEMRQYILSLDSLTLFFNLATPNDIIPKLDDKLVTTEIDSILTHSFVGKVKKINKTENSIEVICDTVGLTEIFEQYYGVTKKVDTLYSAKRNIHAGGFYSTNGTQTYSPGGKSIDLLNSHAISVSYQSDEDMSYSIDDAKMTISLTPIVDYNAYLIVNKDYGINVSVTAIGNYSLEENLALAGKIEIGDDVAMFEKTIAIPEALVDFFFEFGAFAKFDAAVSSEQIYTQKFRHVFHWEWSSNKKISETLHNVNTIKPLANTHMGKIAIEGNVNMGFYAKIGLSFIATSSLDIAEVDLRAEGGISIGGTYVPYKRDEKYAKKSSDLYNQIKDREVGVYWYYGISGEAKLFKWSVSKDIPNFFNIPFNKKSKILGFRLVPLFENTAISRDEDGTYYASSDISGGDVFTTDVGFALINQTDENKSAYTYCAFDYKGPRGQAYSSFFNSPAADYTLYPLVKYMNMELLAEPSAKIYNVAISFQNGKIVNVSAEPKYNDDGEFLFTWYTTKFNYVVRIEGADSIEFVRPIIYDNGTWSYNGGNAKVPGNGLYSISTTMSYDNDADMGWAIGYVIKLKNGSVIFSTNTLQFAGTPPSPTIEVNQNNHQEHENVKLLKNQNKKKYVMFFGNFE